MPKFIQDKNGTFVNLDHVAFIEEQGDEEWMLHDVNRRPLGIIDWETVEKLVKNE